MIDEVFKPESSALVAAVNEYLDHTSKGLVESTVRNYLAIMEHDPKFSGIRYNVLRQRAEIPRINALGEAEVGVWEDADTAASIGYIESQYGLFSKEKHRAALLLLFRSRQFNPLVEIVDQLKWDGVERCTEYLIRYAKAEDCAYSREVSRLLFAQGIHRLYHPGCKAEDVPTLVGPQGSGKSTLIRLLAMDDDFFSDQLRDFSGDKESIESLFGRWIIELGELNAMRRSDVEQAKSFISRQEDSYRKPYATDPVSLKRRVIFVASTNDQNFLSDKSGNRRWYPVAVHCNGYEVFDQEQEIRAYVRQCWAEARTKMLDGDFPPYADRSLITIYREKQASAMQEDYRVGQIEDFLRYKRVGELTCIKLLWRDCLNPPDSPVLPRQNEQREIAQIMDNMTGWQRSVPDRYDFGNGIGRQRAWKKVAEYTSPDTAGQSEDEAQGELPF